MMSHTGKPESLPRTEKAWTRLASAELGPLVALIAIILFFTVADHFFGSGHFASVRNVRVILNDTSIVAVAALGMTLIIISGGIDLSVGTALTLCGTVLAYGLTNDWPILRTVLLTLATGCLCGLLNGLLISFARVVPFVVTLGTMTIFLGIGKIICDESTLFPRLEQIPPWLQTLCSTRPPNLYYGFIPNIPRGVLLAGFLAIAVSVLLHFTAFGRYVFALGSNERTARLCGIQIPLVKTSVYVLAGLFVGVAGIYHFATIRVANPVEGIGLELQVIAAVVLGGGSLNGGRGSIVGTLTGAAIMSVIRSGCDQLPAVEQPHQEIIIGVVIIVAVAVDQIRQRMSRTE